MNKTLQALAGLIAAAPVTLWAAAAEPTKEQTEFFEGKVHPILADHCYKCHSAERGKSKGGLALDTRAGWQKGGESGAAIIPGQPEKSLLHKALTYSDPDLQMPPTSSGGKLSAQQIADIAEWIRMGAPDPRTEAAAKSKLSGLTDSARSHWAYQPVKKPAVPVNKNQQWCRTPIDCFILQKLEANGIVPSPDAPRDTWLRRVTFDLTGLPPTHAEVETFINDTSPKAMEKVVDRLLASPAYGERWGRHWLDTARYSDTRGGERNANRTAEYRYPDAWTYRDYVVRSFNEDKPYTDFIVEQIAADKLPGIRPDDPRLAALGFLTVGERFKNINDVINDRIDVVTKGFLGLTVSCARCHDHMFDPIPTRDYYALHGVFSSTTEPEEKPSLTSQATPAQKADYEAKMRGLVNQLGTRYLDVMGNYLADFYRAPGPYLRAALAANKKRDQGGIAERNDIIKKNKLDGEFAEFLAKGMQRNPAVWAPLISFRSKGSYTPASSATPAVMQKAAKLEKKLASSDGAKAKAAATMAKRAKGGTNPIVDQAFATRQPGNLDEAIEVYAQLFASLAPKTKGFIPAMKKANSQIVPGYENPALVELLSGPFELRPLPLITAEWTEEAQQGWTNKMRGKARFNYGDISMLKASHPGAPPHAMAVQDKSKAVNSPVFLRGQSETKGEVVPRGFLEILSPGNKPVEFKDGSGRLELARCIASRENPLTARVLVNKVWMHHFGEGFVRTPDDLGVMAEKPTHPELLDYLAHWFMESGWSLKKLHKFIVLSRVYHESSHILPGSDYTDKDPENRLLWRANVRRLDFEAMRDSLLVFSGEIDRSVGGKPVNLTEEPYSFRRSVYGYIDRGNLPELMAHFDFSDPDMPNSKRSSTIVPQQALFLMNSPMAVDVAQKILARPEVARQPGDLFRIATLYRIIFQRQPTPREVQLGIQFIQHEAQLQGETASDAKSLMADGAAGKKGAGKKNARDNKFGAIRNEGERVTRRVLTPWETYVHTLLFSNEAAYVN